VIVEFDESAPVAVGFECRDGDTPGLIAVKECLATEPAPATDRPGWDSTRAERSYASEQQDTPVATSVVRSRCGEGPKDASVTATGYHDVDEGLHRVRNRLAVGSGHTGSSRRR
jgi:hypothetical protein